MFNMRSESKNRRRLVAVSPDGVSDWTGHRWDPELLESVCMASLIRHAWPTDAEPGHILFANPSNLENELIRPGGNLPHDRKRLTVKLSRDDGQTWPVSKTLEPGPAGYSDLFVLSDGTILCYETTSSLECGRPLRAHGPLNPMATGSEVTPELRPT